MTDLPIDAILPELKARLAGAPNLVLQAPPGAGKTTRAPLALLDAAWLAGRRIIMLEPRRLAARAAATRMASTLGEAVGETVGYRVRQDSRVGPRTRIEVVTEGVFTRMLQSDPELSGVGAVLFDEFHERSLDADLGLALALEVQGALREDLRILVMSATLDGLPVARLMGGAGQIVSEGRAFPVEVRHLDRPADPRRIAAAVASAIRRALAEEEGSLLVFLPGQGEIRRVESLLGEDELGPEVEIAPLYGDLSGEAQDRAIAPARAGRRKVVLATAIAETSLTIEGVRVVIDSGLARHPRFDPKSGMSRLETVRVSRAAAEQRRGRAGRIEPGVCYRLWPEAEQRALPAHLPPEILCNDLAPLALELAVWGVRDPAELAWIDPPPASAYAQAVGLLRELGAVDVEGAVTAHGRRMAGLGLHPRLAHMVLTARDGGDGGMACDLAALLGERDVLKGRGGARDIDLRARLDLVRSKPAASGLGAGVTVDRAALGRVRQAADRLRRRLSLGRDDGLSGERVGERVGRLVALAYPDRVGQARGGAAAGYRLSGGRGARLPEGDPLAASRYLAIADMDAGSGDGRVFLAAPVTAEDIEDLFAERIETVRFVAWDAREQAVAARRQRRFGALVLADEPLDNPDGEEVAAAVIDGIRRLGLDALPWTKDLQSLRQRVGFLRRVYGADEGWPDLSDQALLDRLEDWLAPFLCGVSRKSQFARIDLAAAIGSLLDWDLRRRLDEEAPTHLTAPSGSRIRLDYSGEQPVLAVRLQEMFGALETPRIAAGRAPVLLHLLSPAGRPVQVTQDLAGFWGDGYRAVKADLKGRYPKHYWPDDPLTASPTARAKPKGASASR